MVFFATSNKNKSVWFSKFRDKSLLAYFCSFKNNECDFFSSSFWHSNAWAQYVLTKSAANVQIIFLTLTPTLMAFTGSPMLVDPYPRQQNSGLQHAVWWPKQEVSRPNARFKPTLPKKSELDGVAIKCQHILISYFTCSPHGDVQISFF